MGCQASPETSSSGSQALPETSGFGIQVRPETKNFQAQQNKLYVRKNQKTVSERATAPITAAASRTPTLETIQNRLKSMLKTELFDPREIDISKGDMVITGAQNYSIESESFSSRIDTFYNHKLPKKAIIMNSGNLQEEYTILLNRKVTHQTKKALENALENYHGKQRHDSALFVSVHKTTKNYNNNVLELKIKSKKGFEYVYLIKTLARRVALAQAGLIPCLAFFTANRSDFYISIQSSFRLSEFERKWAEEEIKK